MPDARPAGSCRPVSRRCRATSCRQSGFPPGRAGRCRCAAQLVELGEEVAGRHRLAVDGNRVALLETDFDIGRAVGRVLGRDGAGIDIFRASSAGSSRPLPSDEVCSRLASTENGASPRLSLAIGNLVLFGKFDAAWCADVRSHSRQGAIDLDVGVRARSSRASNRTWSLPLPVAPWTTASAPVCAAISICRLAISGRAIEVPSR